MIVTARANALTRPPEAATAPTLGGGARVEVCIAGAGLAGMIAGYLLARDKRSVMVLEEGALGGPSFGGEMAHLAALPDSSCAALVEGEGLDAARVAMQGFAAAIDALEAIVRREHIACDFERLDGFALLARSMIERQREVDAATKAGFKGVEAVDLAVRYPGHALLHPGKLAQGLARAIAHQGGRMHCGLRSRAIEGRPVPAILTSAGHRVQADVVVAPAASNASAPPPAAQALAFRVPRGAITRALYWDEAARYCAGLRAQGMRTSDVLLVAGRPKSPGDLEAWAREHFPCVAEVLQRFSADVVRSPPAFAFTGRDLDDGARVYATGTLWASPITRAAIGALVIKDAIDGSRTAGREPHGPSACYTGVARQAHAQEFA